MMTRSDSSDIVSIEISSLYDSRKVKFQTVRRELKIKFLLYLFLKAEFKKEKD